MKKGTWLKDELIGLKVSIKIKGQKEEEKGTIIDETKNTIKIKTAKKEKTLIKKNIKITIQQSDKKHEIEGQDICFRPEERIKKIK